MPLAMAEEGENKVIKKITGKPEVKSFLEKLGFVTGAEVVLVSVTEGNVIVNIKDSRVAIGKEMAMKIIV